MSDVDCLPEAQKAASTGPLDMWLDRPSCAYWRALRWCCQKESMGLRRTAVEGYGSAFGA